MRRTKVSTQSRRLHNHNQRKGSDMKRIILAAGAALLALYPAAVAVGGSTFSQSAAERMPSQAVVMDDNGGQSNAVQTGDDKGGLRNRAQTGDDNGGLRNRVLTGDDKGGLSNGVQTGDDKGGLSNRVQAGDDKGGLRDDGPDHS